MGLFIYLLVSSLWIVINGCPAVPLGALIFGWNTLKNKKKMIVLAIGLVMGGIGPGLHIYYDTSDADREIGVSAQIRVHPVFLKLWKQHKIKTSNVLFGGKAVAERGLELLKSNDKSAFRELYDFAMTKGGADELARGLDLFDKEYGKVVNATFENVEYRYVSKFRIDGYYFSYEISAIKIAEGRITLGVYHSKDGWKIFYLGMEKAGGTRT